MVLKGQLWVSYYREPFSGQKDNKDALLMAKLVKEGHFFKMFLPEGIYRDLRNLTAECYQQRKKLNNAMNRVKALLDRYFPEYVQVFKDLLGQTSLFF